MLNSGAVGGSPMPHQRKPPVNSGSEWWAKLTCARCGEPKEAGQFLWSPRSHRTKRMSICADCFGAASSAGRAKRAMPTPKPKPQCGNHTKEHMERMRQLSIDVRRAQRAAKLAAPAFTEPKPRMWTGILRWVRGLFA